MSGGAFKSAAPLALIFAACITEPEQKQHETVLDCRGQAGDSLVVDSLGNVGEVICIQSDPKPPKP